MEVINSFLNYLTTIAMEPSMAIQNVITVLDVMIIFRYDGCGRNDWIKMLKHFICLVVVLVVLNGVWQVIWGVEGSFFATHFVIILGYAVFIRGMWQKQVFISVLLFYGIEIGMISFSATIPLALGNNSMGETLEIFLRNGIVLFTVIVACYFRRFNILQFKNIPRTSIIYSFLMGAVVFVLSVWYQSNRQKLDYLGNQFALLALASFLLIALMAYYLSYSVCMYNNVTLDLQAENLFARNDAEILKISRHNLEEIRQIRHDIRNHFAYMNVMVQEKRYSELEDYFKELGINIVQPLSRIDCGNPNISAILNLEASKANALGVKLDCRVIVSPQLPFGENDLCGLLTNLIDNALEACERFQAKDAVVEVGINQKPNMLYISVLNPIDESRGQGQLLSLQTTKSLPQQHGYGSKIIDSMVKKYNGEINRCVDQGKYIVDILLDLNWNEENT